MTALDNWLLLCKITLFLELIEYAVVLQVKFSNATLTNLRKMTKRKKQTISTERRSEEEADKLITAKCKKEFECVVSLEKHMPYDELLQNLHTCLQTLIV